MISFFFFLKLENNGLFRTKGAPNLKTRKQKRNLNIFPAPMLFLVLESNFKKFPLMCFFYLIF